LSLIILELTEEERAVLLKHLEGLHALYQHVNNSGSGPLRQLIEKIKCAPLPLRCRESTVDTLLRHIDGASKYDEIAHRSTTLRALVKKIEQAQLGGGFIL